MSLILPLVPHRFIRGVTQAELVAELAAVSGAAADAAEAAASVGAGDRMPVDLSIATVTGWTFDAALGAWTTLQFDKPWTLWMPLPGPVASIRIRVQDRLSTITPAAKGDLTISTERQLIGDAGGAWTQLAASTNSNGLGAEQTVTIDLSMVSPTLFPLLAARRFVVLVAMGGALYRALHEHGHAGLVQDQLGEDMPSGPLDAVPSGVSVVLLDARFRHSFAPLDGSYAELTASEDGHAHDALIVDAAADVSTDPTDPVPTIKAWCEALGGTYHDPNQPAP